MDDHDPNDSNKMRYASYVGLTALSGSAIIANGER
jgi:hypothetical protein